MIPDKELEEYAHRYYPFVDEEKERKSFIAGAQFIQSIKPDVAVPIVEDKIKNIPKRIWLQIAEDGEEIFVDDFSELSSRDICWCAERVFTGDIEYVRAGQSKPIVEEQALQVCKVCGILAFTSDGKRCMNGHNAETVSWNTFQSQSKPIEEEKKDEVPQDLKVKIILKAKNDLVNIKTGETMEFINEPFDAINGIAFYPIDRQYWTLISYEYFSIQRNKQTP